MKCVFVSVCVITVLSVYSMNISLTNELPKCCKRGERINIKVSSYECGAKNKKIFDVGNFDEFDFLAKNKTGECIELYSKNNVAIFSVDNSTNIRKINIKYDFYPKCCLFGYTYNESFHSCAEEKNNNGIMKNILKKNSFYSIGMAHCSIVSDEIFNPSEQFEYDAAGGLIIGKRSPAISKDDYCIDSTLSGNVVVRRCENIEICERERCIRKCCNDGYGYEAGVKSCTRSFRAGVDLFATNKVLNPDENFVIVHEEVIDSVAIEDFSGFDFELDGRGMLTIKDEINDLEGTFRLKDKGYCIEAFFDYDESYSNTVFVKIPKLNHMKYNVTKWLAMVSCIFLLLTIVVYMILPKMRNLFGKMLLCYNASTFLFFLCHTLYQFVGRKEKDTVECRLFGYFYILTCIWSFTWLHMVCLDIWFSFGSSRTSIRTFGTSVKKLFLQYCLGGWALPTVWVSFIILFSETEILPKSIHPYIGKTKCFLEEQKKRPRNYGHLMFLVLPLVIQQIINIVLFIATTWNCWKIRAAIRKVNDGRGKGFLSTSKERLCLVMKLSIVMGIHLVFQFITSIFDFDDGNIKPYIDLFGDCLSCLQGVFIFIIFIFKKKVYQNLLEKFASICPNRAVAVPPTTTALSLQQFEESRGDNTKY